MFPVLAPNNPLNRRGANTVLAPKRREHAPLPRRGIVSGADIGHIRLGEFRLCVGGARGLQCPPLLYRVSHIVQVGAKKDVGRIHAASIVAMMASEHPIRNFADEQRVEQSMGEPRPLAVPSCAVTVGVGTGDPDPTPGRAGVLIDLLVKARNQFVSWQNCHVNLRKRLAVPRAFTAPRGFSLPELYQAGGA